MDTLLLNADGQPLSMLPVSIVSWQTAIKFLMLGKVKVMCEHDWEVRSPSMSMKVPSIIMSTKYVKWPKSVKFNRYNLYLRDDFTCQLQITSRCARDHGKGHSVAELTLDHITPKSNGGNNSWLNLVTACATCNHHKGNAKIVPKRMPAIPSYFELIEKRRKSVITISDLSWLDYLGWDEDLVYYHPHGGQRVKLTDYLNQGDVK
jgi:5-methylcytosine-specific restriction endonuclease McrA